MNFRDRKVTVPSMNSYSTSTDQFRSKLRGKLKSQDDKITQQCRQLVPKGRSDLQQGRNEECSFYAFYQL
jgi:hypothetical protein